MPNNSPSPVSSQKLFSKQKIAYGGVTGAAVLTTGTAFDMRGYAVAAFFATLISSASVKKAGITLFEIICADDSALSVNVTQVKTSGVIDSGGAGDLVALEVTSEEIAQIKGSNSYASRWVAARVTTAASTDVAVIHAVLAEALNKAANLTANSITPSSTTT